VSISEQPARAGRRIVVRALRVSEELERDLRHGSGNREVQAADSTFAASKYTKYSASARGLVQQVNSGKLISPGNLMSRMNSMLVLYDASVHDARSISTNLSSS
jgi:hypothetical protein